MTSAEAALGWVLVGLLFGLPQVAEVSSPGHEASWSQLSPGDRMPADVPQFVAITFDDNFGLALPGSVGGVRAIVKYYAEKHNPAGVGNAADFDGVPIRASFFDTSIYMVDSSERVLGGNEGEDQKGRNRAAWNHQAGLSGDKRLGRERRVCAQLPDPIGQGGREIARPLP